MVSKKSSSSMKNHKSIKKSSKIKDLHKSKSFSPKSMNSDNSASSIKKDLTTGPDADYYDKLFEEKLKSQYREFRDVKERGLQAKKFLRILMVIFTIVLFALLLLTFSR